MKEPWFKRRWDWNYIKIKDAGENFKIVFSNGNTYDWWGFVPAINERIEGGEIQQEDKKLGYFFAKAKDKVITPKVLLSKVLFYLYNDVFKDFGLDEDFFKDENGETMSFASYFGNEGQINEDRVERFVTNLGLEPIMDFIGEENASVSDNTSNDKSSGRKKHFLYITDKDGNQKREPLYNGYFNFVKTLADRFGEDKVAETINSYGITRHKGEVKLMDLEPYQNLNEAYRQKRIGKYYLLLGVNQTTDIANRLNDSFSLGYTIEEVKE